MPAKKFTHNTRPVLAASIQLKVPPAIIFFLFLNTRTLNYVAYENLKIRQKRSAIFKIIFQKKNHFYYKNLTLEVLGGGHFDPP